MDRKQLLIFGFTREYCQSHKLPVPPVDIVMLFALWTSLSDSFDKEASDESIDIIKMYQCYENMKYETVQRSTEDWNGTNHYSTAVGTNIISKGMKQIWKFKILQKKKNSTPTILIGIIDNNVTKSMKYIGTFWQSKVKGYGLSFYSGKKFHDDNKQGLTCIDKYDFRTIEKFTMILDLTQTNGKNGILSYKIDGINMKSTENARYENNTKMAFDDIDIQKEYRCAVGLYLNKQDVVALLPRFAK